MKKLLFYFVLLLVAIWLGVAMHAHPGYLLISYGQTSVETTLWFAIIAALIIFFLLYGLARLFSGTHTLSGRVKKWSEQRHSRKAMKRTTQGICQWAEGDWAGAEQRLVQAAKYKENPLVNYLTAANAAHKQGAFDRRDKYLHQAQNATAGANLAIDLIQARLQIEAQQFEQALATLTRLNKQAPRHVMVLSLLRDVYAALNDWESLRLLLGCLRKRKVMATDDFGALEQRVYLALLEDAKQSTSSNLLHQHWQALPRHLRKDPRMIEVFVDATITAGETAKAEPLLHDALKKQWDQALIKRYGLVEGANARKQLATAEAWLKTHGNDADLLLCLGRLCKRQKLWGKAKSYLESSLALSSQTDTRRELGEILEQLGEQEAALLCYRGCCES